MKEIDILHNNFQSILFLYLRIENFYRTNRDWNLEIEKKT